jgi:hypothetical protein
MGLPALDRPDDPAAELTIWLQIPSVDVAPARRPAPQKPHGRVAARRDEQPPEALRILAVIPAIPFTPATERAGGARAQRSTVDRGQP